MTAELLGGIFQKWTLKSPSIAVCETHALAEDAANKSNRQLLHDSGDSYFQSAWCVIAQSSGSCLYIIQFAVELGVVKDVVPFIFLYFAEKLPLVKEIWLNRKCVPSTAVILGKRMSRCNTMLRGGANVVGHFMLAVRTQSYHIWSPFLSLQQDLPEPLWSSILMNHTLIDTLAIQIIIPISHCWSI